MLFTRRLFQIVADRDKKNIELINVIMKKSRKKYVIRVTYGIDIALFFK